MNMEDINIEKFEAYVPVITSYATKIAGAIVLLFLAFFVAGKLKNLTMKAMDKARIDQTLSKFAGNAVKWAVLGISIVSILGVFGIETASFAALIAAMGLAIGLSFQGTLSNLASGVMLLVFRPFKVGQFIKVAGEAGTVDEIGIFTTSIDTVDKRRVILPNSSVFGSTIENVSHHPVRRCDVAIGTDYSADLDQTKEILKQVIAANDLVLRDPESAVVLTGLGASSVDWALRCFVKAEDYWTVYEKLMWDAKKALDKAKIGIPFPQMDVHIHKD